MGSKHRAGDLSRVGQSIWANRSGPADLNPVYTVENRSVLPISVRSADGTEIGNVLEQLYPILRNRVRESQIG